MHKTNQTIKGSNQPKRIAVIGSGISSLSAAWFLGQEHEVVLFEKDSRLGGHTNTVDVYEKVGKALSIDTGFIVFNRPNYPNLTKMFKYLGVTTQNTDMSFSVSIDKGNNSKLEYSGTDLNGLFAQRSNILSWQHWSMIGEILRFNRLAKSQLKANSCSNMCLSDYLDKFNFSTKMREHYLLPMAAAIWSCPVETMLRFPTRSFLQFFENHGLLNIEDRPQWETVTNGSKTYIDKILAQGNFECRLNTAVVSIEQENDQVVLHTNKGQLLVFDEVILGCHADQAWRMMDANLRQTFSPLANFRYQENIAYLHCDSSLMPEKKRAWSSWNYLRDMQKQESSVAVSYWMNLLQQLDTSIDYFVTLNPSVVPQQDKTIKKIVYEHPVFDEAAVNSQSELCQLQGQHHIWLCGSYFGYGFHEDGLSSSVALMRLWGIDLPWERAVGFDQESSANNADLTNQYEFESKAS
ncbi:NAD/FAD-binding protein [Thiomicrorhabdus sediminis]|uniref:NAD/FAD-binding protein n=2 Tax=Thiomicrorhabdus sediminis TaxID=2580412 RepID=A0A4P9K615_9GAMM|nr:NAD/FAD-binding protein [Thiomicrorhabdus sediminis]